MAKHANVAIIGTKFMGKAHSNAYDKVNMFFDSPTHPVKKVICGRDEADTKAAAAKLGWEEWSTDWKSVVARDDIDVVDISAPGYMHHPMVMAAAKLLREGKAKIEDGIFKIIKEETDNKNEKRR